MVVVHLEKNMSQKFHTYIPIKHSDGDGWVSLSRTRRRVAWPWAACALLAAAHRRGHQHLQEPDLDRHHQTTAQL